MFFKKASSEAGDKKAGLFERMKQAFTATKNNLVNRIEAVLTSKPGIDEKTLEDIEGILLGADLGVTVTTRVMNEIRAQRKQGLLNTPDDVKASIRKQLLETLELGKEFVQSAPPQDGREVWMIVGVNGTGKTTTVGKLASRMAAEGRKTLVCAADTFRPAAIEQLTVWVERSGADLIKSRIGADPSSVLHDALAAAAARGSDVVLVDTAGRLHTRGNLMQELGKMKRVAGRQVPGAPHEVLLVMDATTGQNGLTQAKEFMKSVGVTGLIVTKLDGTAKGGILFSISSELNIPVRFIGVGEAIEDLLEFSPSDFVDSLFSQA
jgi:fused signal recognition particle receptor